MAARATSTGTISFGLVSIPIKVYGATTSKAVRFSLLHDKDKSRLKQQFTCAACGEVVPRTETVKGYEYARGQYVVLTDDELKALEAQADKSIEIEEFIPIDQVDPVHFEKASLLGPDKGGAKAYRLLQAAMKRAGRVALGRFSTRGRQQLVLLRPSGHGLMMHALYHADEVRAFEDIELGEAPEPKKAELDLADQLIDQLSADTFRPEKYEDRYRRAVLAAVEQKVAGEEVVVIREDEVREQVIDLVAALKQSLASTRGEARARKPPKAKGGKKASGRKPGSGRASRKAR